MKYSLSISTKPAGKRPALFGDGNIIANLEIVKELGFDGVDIFIHEPDDRERDQLIAALRSTGLSAVVIFPVILLEKGLNLSNPDKAGRAEAVSVFKSQIDLAQSLEADIVLGLGRGGPLEGESTDVFEKRLADSVKELEDYAGQRDIRVIMEPITRFLTPTYHRVEECLEFLEKFGLKSLELLIDFFHMNIEEASIEQAITLAGARIGHIHVTDSNRMAPGDGHLDYESLLKAVLDTGYDRFLSVETDPASDPRRTASSGLAHLKSVMAGLGAE
jgi:sugar phosphate isomerase/epimerase